MKKSNWFVLSIISGIMVLLFNLFEPKLADDLNLLMVPVFLLVYSFFICTAILSLILLFKNKDWKPIVVQAITALLLFFVPFNQIILNMDFKWNHSKREQVVKMVEDGTLKPNVSHNSSLIHLPKEYQSLSSGGGDIAIEHSGDGYNILFFTFRGILGGFSGFVYSTDGQPPSDGWFGGDIKEVHKMDNHWYIVGPYE
ncbi:hypothetical protein SFC65_20175 [Priestia filamentosa]|uniref:hypothetical protein n=1 Tax=Priestia filamentosa TaxID=1402861 RepID=UPI0039821D65